MSPLTPIVRRLGLGRIAYHLWHRHYGPWRDLWLDGGPWQRRRTEAGRREMIAAAASLPLPPAPPPDGAPVTLHLLTGRKYWYQTAFCLWTFARHARRPLHPVVLDDGTLGPEEREPILRLFPQTRFVDDGEVVARLDDVLPAARYPVLRARRRAFPLLRKLTDLHAGLRGWKLFLDSDLLFFRLPAFLLGWHDRPGIPLRGEDIANAYGYPLPLLAELAGRPVPERVNTGTLGLRSDEIDWDRMEAWCRELQARVGPHYYQEQALTALLLAGRDCAIPPPADHVVLPLPPEAIACRAVMHHYVAHSKRYYLQRNWRHVLD